MIRRAIDLDILQEFPCIYQTMRNSNLKFDTFKEVPRLDSIGNSKRGFFDTLKSGDRLDMQIFNRQFTIGHNFIGRTQGSFHNTAGIRKDISRT